MDRHRRAAVFVQDPLREVGVQAEIRVLDESLMGDRQESGRFEAVIRPGGGRVLLDQYLVDDSRPGFLPERLMKLARVASREPEWRAREAAFRDLAEVFRADLPATFLYPLTRAVAARREVRGLELLGEGVWEAWRWPLAGVEFLWMEEDEP